MRIFEDQLNRKLSLEKIPSRIVSLVPSQTELLFDLGLNEEVVGITKFCIHPAEWFNTKTRIGGTKNFNLKKIAELNPDLIIGNKEENDQQQIGELSTHYKVWMSDVKTLNDALKMIEQIGMITGKTENANSIINQIKVKFNLIKPIIKNISVAYLIWYNPLMVVGNNTFIHNMLFNCGFKNAMENDSRYVTITNNQLIELNPNCIFLSSEPFPFKQKHLLELKALLPHSKIIFVDGEMFSWYGSRLLKAPEYFAKLIAEVSTVN